MKQKRAKHVKTNTIKRLVKGVKQGQRTPQSQPRARVTRPERACARIDPDRQKREGHDLFLKPKRCHLCRI